MALVYNNLLINMNSKKYQPFLLNLVSGRRRVLHADEFQFVRALIDGDKTTSDFSDNDAKIFHKLKSEKQFMDDAERKEIEEKLTE